MKRNVVTSPTFKHKLPKHITNSIIPTRARRVALYAAIAQVLLYAAIALILSQSALAQESAANNNGANDKVAKIQEVLTLAFDRLLLHPQQQCCCDRPIVRQRSREGSFSADAAQARQSPGKHFHPYFAL